MVLIDEVLVNISAPQIGAAMALSPAELSWLVNAYLLPFGGLLLLGGRVGDILGRRRVFLAGVALYTVASVMRGLAPEAWILIAARALQGVGAAMVVPSVLALIMSMFAEGPLRKKAIGLYTIVSSAGTAAGLLLVGVLAETVSWRILLMVNVPIGIALLVLAPLLVRETVAQAGRFDLTGALLSTLGLVGLVYALSGTYDPTEAMISLAAGLALLALWIVVGRRTEQPIVPFGLFTDRSRVFSYLAMMTVQGTHVGQIFFLSQYFQEVLNWSAMLVAISLIPVAVGIFSTANLIVRFDMRFGHRATLVAGSITLLAANLWLGQLQVTDSYWYRILPGLLLIGAGLAAITIPATIQATSEVDEDGSGSASGVLNAMQTVGASLCLAVIIGFAMTAGESVRAAAPAGLPADALDDQVLVESMLTCFAVGAGFAAATLLVSLFVRQGRRRTS
ncbi:MFS transporter [Couchioplanes azureus]|uniref:MFS transporter n=1 Tax=Couchioplanes caeruleus TaxID=56438 RepID=UPI00166F9B44|nr:MFS transporter [Couchioplanes caeruleus]GGQ86068.1 MFS transporter [Couchioplanes caeruleus subsp. azureus]